MDYRFHTKEQQDFYETILVDKNPIVCDMKWVDWEFIDENEDYFPGVHESFKSCGVVKFVGRASPAPGHTAADVSLLGVPFTIYARLLGASL